MGPGGGRRRKVDFISPNVFKETQGRNICLKEDPSAYFISVGRVSGYIIVVEGYGKTTAK
jgi:hypothetical protein